MTFPHPSAAALAAMLCVLSPLVHAVPVEEQMSAISMADFEFDSARNGTYCPTCNFGAGNARVTYIDPQYNLWVLPVDWTTGKFGDSQAHFVDINAAFVSDYGNGPQWAFSQRGSELTYTRYLDKQPKSDRTAGVAFAHMTAPGTWQAGFIPGGMGRVAPKGTMNETDPEPRLTYGDVQKPRGYWRFADPSAQEMTVPGDGSNSGIGLRWIDGTTEILFSNTPKDKPIQIYVQDTATQVTDQITSGDGEKVAQSIVYPPEFGGDAIFFTVVDKTRIDFYRKLPNARGVLRWTKFGTITPPADQPNIAGSPEAFIYNNRTWIVLTVKATTGVTDPSNIAIVSANPDNPEWHILTDNNVAPRWRADPEYFMADDSVYIYYSRSIGTVKPVIAEGIWRVDTGLGPKQP